MKTDNPPPAVQEHAARVTGSMPPARHSSRGGANPALAPDVWLVAVSLAAGLGTARLTEAPGAAHVVGPITATVLAGHLAASVARRLRVSAGVVLVAGVVAVALATIWGQLLSATRDGIPTAGTWRTLVSRFEAAGTVIRSHPTPVPATPEVVMCIAIGAGLVAVFARAIWARQEALGRGALLALVPSFGLFCYTALLSSQVDRVPGAVAYLVCALGFVITADGATSGAGSAWRRTGQAQRWRRSGAAPGSPQPSAGPGSAQPSAVSMPRRVASAATAAFPAVLGAALAVFIPLAASPALAGLKVDALPFDQQGGSGAAQGLGLTTGAAGAGADGGAGQVGVPGSTGVRAIDLVDNLKAVLVNRTTEVMFSAQTPLPTYWQLAVLTLFNGTAWLPDPTTQAAAQSDALLPPSQEVPGLPALPEPAPTKTFRAGVTIAALESTLLPLPPTTVSVNTAADLVPGFGAVQPFEAAPGLSYVAVARVPTTTAKVRRSTSAASPGAPASSLTPYLQLPSEPAAVVQLAHRIVAGVKGPAAQAAALARWFDTGRYRYTLSPPAPTGPNALESFLFTTRAGFCQQFAAAYGVLARIDGLPTRIAVGFTTGSSQGHDRYQITGADAHVWPEVYLGASTGWASYEPTPASSGEATGVGINSGTRTGARNSGAQSTATTTPPPFTARDHFAASATVPATIPAIPRGGTGTVTGSGSSSSAPLVLGAIGVGLVALIVLGGLWVRRLVREGRFPPGLLRLRRRRGRRRRPAPDPTAEVLAQWREAETVLEHARLGRRPAETLQEHAARLRSLASAKWLLPYRPVIAGAPTPVTPGAPTPVTPGSPTPAPGIDATIDAYGRLAELAGRASYGSEPCTAGEAADAELLGAVVRSGLSGPGARLVSS